jgi:Zn-dependent M28 family amino/carboxypeptidase
MYLTWLGSVLVAAGALLGRRGQLRLGIAFALGTVAAMADIGARDVVPGANDNLSSVAVLLAVAKALRERPVEDLRVILLSTGSEESFMEGMRGFGARHFPTLAVDRTQFLCLECLGGPTLTLLEGEGMLRMRDYPAQAREALAAAALRAGVELGRNLRTVAATDALIALRAGYDVALLASVDYTHLPSNYHWRSDTPENLDWETIGQAMAVTEQFVRDAAGAQVRTS